ncbi:conserved hypothetical protein, partial [Ricinus communis]
RFAARLGRRRPVAPDRLHRRCRPERRHRRAGHRPAAAGPATTERPHRHARGPAAAGARRRGHAALRRAGAQPRAEQPDADHARRPGDGTDLAVGKLCGGGRRPARAGRGARPPAGPANAGRSGRAPAADRTPAPDGGQLCAARPAAQFLRRMAGHVPGPADLPRQGRPRRAGPEAAAAAPAAAEDWQDAGHRRHAGHSRLRQPERRDRRHRARRQFQPRVAAAGVADAGLFRRAIDAVRPPEPEGALVVRGGQPAAVPDRRHGLRAGRHERHLAGLAPDLAGRQGAGQGRPQRHADRLPAEPHRPLPADADAARPDPLADRRARRRRGQRRDDPPARRPGAFPVPRRQQGARRVPRGRQADRGQAELRAGLLSARRQGTGQGRPAAAAVAAGRAHQGQLR